MASADEKSVTCPCCGGNAWPSEMADIAKEIERLQAVNERDRSQVADGITKIWAALRSREWLRLGRGSYEWDDDRWKDEFGAAFDEIVAALDTLQTIAGNFADCPTTQAAVFAARAATSQTETEQRGGGENLTD